MSDIVILGHTGTRRGMTKAQLVTLRELLDDLWIATMPHPQMSWHHGCSGKADVAGSYLAAALGMKVIGHPTTTVEPEGYWDILLPARPSLDRDEDIAKVVGHLFATPEHDKEDSRSGSWATVRRARKHNTPHTIIFRDGTYEVF